MTFRVSALVALATCALPLNEAFSRSSFRSGSLMTKFGEEMTDMDGLSRRSELSTSLKVLSKEETMAEMTMSKAYQTFKSMASSKTNTSIISYIRSKLDDDEQAAPTGYAAVDSARNLLNDMMNEAILNKELEIVKCNKFEFDQLKIIRELEQDIAFANSEASGAKAEMGRAQQVIQVVEEVRLPDNRLQLSQHNERCRLEIAVLQQQLSIVLADIEVMKLILKMVCADDVRTVGQLPEFLELASTSGTGAGSIVKCTSCMTGRQSAWLRHNKIRPYLAKLRSKIARDYVESNLLNEFDDIARRSPTRVRTVLLETKEIQQELPEGLGLNKDAVYGGATVCNEQMVNDNSSNYRGCQTETTSGLTCQKWSLQSPHRHELTALNHPNADVGDHNHCRNPDNRDTIWCFTEDPNVEWEYCSPLVELSAPTGITKHECVETNACKLGAANCGKLTDRFLVIMSGIIEKRDQLSDELEELEGDCKTTKDNFELSISTLENQLKEEQTNLASASKSLTENQQQSDQANTQHGTLSSGYHRMMGECCDNKNAFTGEICALEKIRGELYKLEGLKVFITDCEVSEWTDEECSVTCAGGTQGRTRSIIVHPINGTVCPPLRMEQSCNPQGCPVNCEVGDWEGWGDCTAECGGGVITRSRPKNVEPENGGDPCPEQTESRECNGAACNANCVLGDWTEWTQCSKVCGGGNEERVRPITEEKRGTGICAPPDSEFRLDFNECNEFSCSQMVKPGHTLVNCTEMIDLVIVLDGSGSLGSYGWRESKAMAEKLISGLSGGEYGINAALMLFSGPWRWEDYEGCTGGGDPSNVPSPETCGVMWKAHLTGDMNEVFQAAENLEWPGRTTLTSLALAEASNELLMGRQDAKSVVVVITDGKPMSNMKVAQASADLKQKARLMWIPVGSGIKSTIEEMKGWASEPWEDNMLIIDSFATLDTPDTVNNMITGFCTQFD